MNTEIGIKRIDSKSEFYFELQKESNVIEIKDTDYIDSYYIISINMVDRPVIGLSCYDDGLTPKAINMDSKKSVICFNENLVLFDFIQQKVIHKKQYDRTILDLFLFGESIIIIHENGVEILDLDFSIIGSHNRNIQIEDYKIFGNKLEIKFEDENEYFLSLSDCSEVDVH